MIAKDVANHLYQGSCPDKVEGWDSRDPECPACLLLDRIEAMMGAPSKESCRTCRFCREPANRVYREMACHKMPPDINGMWPKVQFADWCGAYEKAGPTQ